MLSRARQTDGIGTLQMCFGPLIETLDRTAYRQPEIDPSFLVQAYWTLQTRPDLVAMDAQMTFLTLDRGLLPIGLTPASLDAMGLWNEGIQVWETLPVTTVDSGATLTIQVEQDVFVNQDITFVALGNRCLSFADCDPFPTFLPTSTPMATATPTPPPPPVSLLAGYMATDLSAANGGTLQVLAVPFPDLVAGTQTLGLYAAGIPLGVTLSNAPASGGDPAGAYGALLPLGAPLAEAQFLIDIQTEAGGTAYGPTWPYLNVSP